ncbi:MAG: hypothetical protein AAGH65_11985 [Pseudomonadota bacterium]
MIQRLAGMLIGLVGVLLLVAAGWYGVEAVQFMHSTVSTDGVIVAHERTAD